MWGELVKAITSVPALLMAAIPACITAVAETIKSVVHDVTAWNQANVDNKKDERKHEQVMAETANQAKSNENNHEVQMRSKNNMHTENMAMIDGDLAIAKGNLEITMTALNEHAKSQERIHIIEISKVAGHISATHGHQMSNIAENSTKQMHSVVFYQFVICVLLILVPVLHLFHVGTMLYYFGTICFFVIVCSAAINHQKVRELLRKVYMKEYDALKMENQSLQYEIDKLRTQMAQIEQIRSEEQKTLEDKTGCKNLLDYFANFDSVGKQLQGIVPQENESESANPLSKFLYQPTVKNFIAFRDCHREATTVRMKFIFDNVLIAQKHEFLEEIVLEYEGRTLRELIKARLRNYLTHRQHEFPRWFRGNVMVGKKSTMAFVQGFGFDSVPISPGVMEFHYAVREPDDTFVENLDELYDGAQRVLSKMVELPFDKSTMENYSGKSVESPKKVIEVGNEEFVLTWCYEMTADLDETPELPRSPELRIKIRKHYASELKFRFWLTIADHEDETKVGTAAIDLRMCKNCKKGDLDLKEYPAFVLTKETLLNYFENHNVETFYIFAQVAVGKWTDDDVSTSDINVDKFRVPRLDDE